MPIRAEEVDIVEKKDGSASREKMLLPKYFLGNSPEEAESVRKEFHSDVEKIAARAHRYTKLDLHDLEQEAWIGVARAIRDFEPGRGALLRTIVISKIKDALRDFITSQIVNVRPPHYIQEALRFMGGLRIVLEKGVHVSPYASLTDLWELSGSQPLEGGLKEDIESIRANIMNLAKRSHASVIELLERAELLPVSFVEIDGSMFRQGGDSIFSAEDMLIDKVDNFTIINRLREMLSEEDFNLLYARFVENETLEEQGEKLGIKPSSVVVRTDKILDRLRHHKDRILNNENIPNFKEACKRGRRSVLRRSVRSGSPAAKEGT